jgi:hypothetical protein
MKFLIILLLSVCAYVHATCVQCATGFTPQPFCHECPDRGVFGECYTPHGKTCGYVNALPNDKSCSRGSWGCITDCCKE